MNTVSPVSWIQFNHGLHYVLTEDKEAGVGNSELCVGCDI